MTAAGTYDRNKSLEERQAAQRDRIVAAVMDAFATMPSDTIGIEHIATEAQVARRSIYVHFDGWLDELRLLAFRRHAEAFFQATVAAIARAQVEDPLVGVLDVIRRMLIDEPRRITFLLGSITKDDSPISTLRSEYRERLIEIWLSLHAMHFDAGETPRPIARWEVEVLLGMLRGCISVGAEMSTPEERVAPLDRFFALYQMLHPYAPKVAGAAP